MPAFPNVSVVALAALVALGLAGCGSTPKQAPKSSGSVASAPSQPSSGSYKVGRPYTIRGITYSPREEPTYSETGIASWYGPNFHGKRTANGEVFNRNEMTAAHRTLPMPSAVRVTNLDNGRSVIVRINDRGPFARGRIIDLSEAAAEELDYKIAGVAKVRVEGLGEESRLLKQAAERGAGAVEQEQILRSYVAQAGPQGSVRVIPVTAADDDIFVQAGAFTERANADRLASSLAHIASTRVSQANVDGRIFYRVRLGVLSGVPEADAVLARVVAAGHPNARIVVE